METPDNQSSANDRQADLGSAHSDGALSTRAAVSHAIRRTGGPSALAVTAAPTLVFLGVDAIGGLGAASVATLVTAASLLGWRLHARQQVRHALLGALVAMACAAVAAGTGQARGFFLLPMAVPAAATAACLLSVLADRPMAGLVANRIVGGPPQWRSIRPLRRFYLTTTLLISLVSLASLAVQVALYLYAEVAWLGLLHVLMGPLWIGITAVSIVLSRIAVTRYGKQAEYVSFPETEQQTR
ncbi:DUF3159 domain-containing protein [Streptomyces olivaceoviridis]|uniref:DUF3159 domain-containing protein n=1 Tax=Streptomyces olivaceoviridis TaxID=1921 RepID=UPI0033326B11